MLCVRVCFVSLHRHPVMLSLPPGTVGILESWQMKYSTYPVLSILGSLCYKTSKISLESWVSMSYKITLANTRKAKYCHPCTKQHSTLLLLPMTGHQEFLPFITTGNQTPFSGTKLPSSVSLEAPIEGSSISYNFIQFVLEEILMYVRTRFLSVH